MSNAKPLLGVKVIDLTQFMSGPACGKMLADWGADVIKVESLTGDPHRAVGGTLGMPCSDGCNPYFGFLNYNKRSIAINLKNPDGMGVLKTLLSEADVFITNWRAKALKKLGLDYETLHEQYPRLIWGTINGFGNYGPDKDNAGYDTVAFWAKTGFMIDQTEKGEFPAIPFLGTGDNASGTALAGAVGTALYGRERTGEGCQICVTLYGTGIWSSTSGVMQTQHNPNSLPKSRSNPSDPLVNTYKTKDGDWIMTSVFQRDKLVNYLRAVGCEELLKDPRFADYDTMLQHSPEVVCLLENAFAGFTTDEMVERLKEQDIAFNRIVHSVEVHKDPQALENGLMTEYVHPDGTVTTIPMPPIIFGDKHEPEVRRQYPRIGEQSVEILREIGISENKIEEMLNNKTILQS